MYQDSKSISFFRSPLSWVVLKMMQRGLKKDLTKMANQMYGIPKSSQVWSSLTRFTVSAVMVCGYIVPIWAGFYILHATFPLAPFLIAVQVFNLIRFALNRLSVRAFERAGWENMSRLSRGIFRICYYIAIADITFNAIFLSTILKSAPVALVSAGIVWGASALLQWRQADFLQIFAGLILGFWLLDVVQNLKAIRKGWKGFQPPA